MPNNFAAGNHNRSAWNQLARQGQRFTRAASDEDFRNPLQILDGSGWLQPGIQGKQVLCLAAGGGRQGPLYAATGAHVTVVDISPAQLELDRDVARERGLQLRTVETSMDDLSMFAEAEFDVVIHPVSSCYLPNLKPVYQQIARVTRQEGLYIGQHKQPISLQATTKMVNGGYQIQVPYMQNEVSPLPSVQGSLHREEGTMEFLHRWDQLIGGLCQSGFVIEDLMEPSHADPNAPAGSFGHRSCFVAPYVRIKARRQRRDETGVSQAPSRVSRLELPE